MTTKQQQYQLTVKWTGNTGSGTASKDSYERSHEVSVKGKQKLKCSSDSHYKGDKTKNNPEDLLLASLSACHMLWFLHFCAMEGVVVIDYVDNAEGRIIQTTNGAGYFTEVVLNPMVIVQHNSMINKALQLNKKASEFCFIANSMKFPVYNRPSILELKAGAAA
ncbi:MAG: OsmC family protein [Bacteroidetes bacterium]|nr:OsmC family protein [Bacteroidota bacterium]